MQGDKSTKKVEQIEKISTSPERISQSISDVMNKFEVKPILKKLDVVKRCGALASTITFALVVLPFLGVGSIAALFKSGLNKSDIGKKDVYYDLKNNENIDWRNVLQLIAKRFKYLVSRSNAELSRIKKSVQQISALIFDDSALEKTGKSIEGIGYVYDHVTNTHILGYKLLVCCYWDGTSIIPIDFSLHKEVRNRELKKAEVRLDKQVKRISKKESEISELKKAKTTKKELLLKTQKTYENKQGKTNKKKLETSQKAVERKDAQIKRHREELKELKTKRKELETQYFELKSNYRYCGLKQKDYQNQYKKKRDKTSFGYKRIKETNVSKIDTMIKMMKRAVKQGFRPDYILTDTWFFSLKLLNAVIEIGRSIDLVSMASIGKAKYNILPDDKLLNPHEIITRYERTKGKNSRKYKARYIQFQAEYQGVRVKIFLIRFGRSSNWRMLVTTDLKMSFIKIMEVYKIRWTIEVFFKECKQYLLLGKSQSQDFDAQIADTTLSMIRYILLSYYERTHYGTTIGGLFRKLSQASVEENLLADISIYFMELLQLFANLAGIDFLDFYEDLLRTPEAASIMERIGINLKEEAA